MAPWHDAAKRNNTIAMAQLIATNRGAVLTSPVISASGDGSAYAVPGTMLHAWNASVCSTCHSRSPDNGWHWGSCHRRQCANYGSRWNGNTALHDAAAAVRCALTVSVGCKTHCPSACAVQGHLEVAKLLLECGANVNATNKHAQTPLDLAQGKAAAALLRGSGAILGADGTYVSRALSRASSQASSGVGSGPLTDMDTASA